MTILIEAEPKEIADLLRQINSEKIVSALSDDFKSTVENFKSEYPARYEEQEDKNIALSIKEAHCIARILQGHFYGRYGIKYSRSNGTYSRR